jgi:hypothetical protein
MRPALGADDSADLVVPNVNVEAQLRYLFDRARIIDANNIDDQQYATITVY